MTNIRDRSRNILVVAPIKGLDLVLKKHVKTKKQRGCFENDEFYFYSNFYAVETPLDLGIIYSNCCVIIDRESIGCVIGIADLGGIVQAALVEAYPHLTGPSFEGSYVCLNKYYTRQLVGSKASVNVAYDCTDVTRFDFAKRNHTPLSANKSFPVFVKPAMGTASCLVGVAREDDSLRYQMKLIKNNVKGILSPFKGLIEQFLDLKKYPQALDGLVMLEQYIDIIQEPVSIHGVDGLVSHGKIVPWAIGDNIYWPHRPQCFQGCGFPSALSRYTQEEIWKVFHALVENLQKFGFDNEFVDVELFVFRDGTFKLMEINGRAFHFMFKIYDEILNKGDITEAYLSVNRGITPEQPTLKPNQFGLFAYLSTFGSGKVGDFINIDKLADYSDISRFGFEVDSPVEPKGESGFTLGYLSIIDVSYEACLEKMHSIKTDLLKQPEFSPWWNN
ncbi:unnamed protein product [Owenia fusiformis]|uniref:Uncharacterized protein n=1 Tax=Owenia fusiformis TaxID=6347 RepID=A0A8J1XJN3_OWEFU|nr:unnamed protein product [Owenia fusiformis]